LLTSGGQDVPVRQQTLRNTIAWSYNLLDASEQRLFHWLAVFVGGCTLEAIEAVCSELDDGAGVVLEGVASLIDKNLLQQREQEDSEPRFGMLETIREYGQECLIASGEMEITRQAHAQYYLALAEAGELARESQQDTVWLARCEQEHDNLRAAVNWLLACGEIELALRLGAALWWFWGMHDHVQEGWHLLEQALAGGEGVSVPVRAKALWSAGRLVGSLGHFERGETLCKESLALARQVGDTRGIIEATFHLAKVAVERCDFVAARSLLEESLALAREAGDKFYIAWGQNILAYVALWQGEYGRARPLAEECLTRFRELGAKVFILSALSILALVAFFQGDLASAQALTEENLVLGREQDNEGAALDLLGEITLFQGDPITARLLIETGCAYYRERGNEKQVAWNLSLLGRVSAVQGDYQTAQASYEESLLRGGEVDSSLFPVDIAPALEGLATVVAAQGQAVWAARLWGAAEARREALGSPLPPVYRPDYERQVAAVRVQLGEQSYVAAWAEGRTMTPDQALAAKGHMTVPAEQYLVRPGKSLVSFPHGLTAREVEVLRLVASGFTDGQVAEQLVISPRTVNTHLKSIYGKIQVSSRSAATRYALEQKLV
jgi:DNA-binding CsgD family transcriptional regulator/tetratricopeptide (TPR) repeat protein